ncbi:hypothetical protein AB0F91_19600 [Amycolatopsis sp. NPDC023774]|uniref:hypothetical protein n=1 Tax=Amycolatopsis sp. NPDC023774 TaxID=3155015 RepID=UPI0033FB4DB8
MAGEQQLVLPERVLTMKMPVDPVRKDCFQIQGTDRAKAYLSRTMPARAAVLLP